MRRMLAAGSVLLMALVLVAPANAAAPTPLEKKLQTQMSTLQKQIPALQKQVKTLQKQVKDLQNYADALTAVNLCSTALAADALQTTWATINLSSTGAIFGTAESAVNDTGACTAFKVTRQTTGVPNLTAFKALFSLFASFG